MSQKGQRHLNILLTEKEYQRVKEAFKTHGTLSKKVRALLLSFIDSKERRQGEDR